MSIKAQEIQEEEVETTNPELPEGWAYSRLGAIGVYLNGRAFKTSEWSKKGRPIIRIQDLTGTRSNPNYFEGAVEERHIVCPGDLLISWSATLGAYIWGGVESVLNQHIFKVESSIDKDFHRWLVQYILDDLQRETHGSGMVHVTKGIFDRRPVTIPPLAEQKRILIGLTSASSTIAGAKNHLSKSSIILKHFRQVVLAAACSGKLTEDWRRNNPETLPADHAIGALEQQSRKIRRGVPEIVPETDEISDIELPNTWIKGSVAIFVGEGDLLVRFFPARRIADSGGLV